MLLFQQTLAGDGVSTNVAGAVMGDQPFGTFFVMMPRLADGERLALRFEVRIEGNSAKTGLVIPTCEVFDTATGKTKFRIGQDFIIDDGK